MRSLPQQGSGEMARPTGSSDAMVVVMDGWAWLDGAGRREEWWSTTKLLCVDAGAVCYSDGIARWVRDRRGSKKGTAH